MNGGCEGRELGGRSWGGEMDLVFKMQTKFLKQIKKDAVYDFYYIPNVTCFALFLCKYQEF